MTRTATGYYTIVWDQEFSNDKYVVTCNGNPNGYSMCIVCLSEQLFEFNWRNCNLYTYINQTDGAYCGLNHGDGDAITNQYARLEIRNSGGSNQDTNLITVFAFKQE